MANQLKSCSVDGCNNPYHAKGYCGSHYMRMSRHGDPLSGITPKGEAMRFVHDVALHHTGDACLPWPFYNSKGYGQIQIDGKTVLASRYICELANGRPPTPKHEAAHSCGKGHEGCISPVHLGWKTKAENEADKLEHGTHNRGDRNGQAKLTEADAREILAMKGVEPQGNLAERFMVSQATISFIHAGKNWAWLQS